MLGGNVSNFYNLMTFWSVEPLALPPRLSRVRCFLFILLCLNKISLFELSDNQFQTIYFLHVIAKKDPLRFSIMDTKSTVSMEALARNVAIITESLLRYLYNVTEVHTSSCPLRRARLLLDGAENWDAVPLVVARTAIEKRVPLFGACPTRTQGSYGVLKSMEKSSVFFPVWKSLEIFFFCLLVWK